jgi:hypothetical protein
MGGLSLSIYTPHSHEIILALRLANRVQISSDALNAYVHAIEEGFGRDVDYGQIVKFYDAEPCCARWPSGLSPDSRGSDTWSVVDSRKSTDVAAAGPTRRFDRGSPIPCTVLRSGSNRARGAAIPSWASVLAGDPGWR